MEKINLEFKPSANTKPQKAFVGVVASGDLEILIEPINEDKITVVIETSIDGQKDLWKNIIERALEMNSFPSCHICIHDFGASPGVIQLRFEQIFAKI